MSTTLEIPRVTVQCRILADLFNEGPLTLSELVADTAETFEAYKTAWYMCRQGWIEKEGFHYKLTPYGISMIAAGAEDSCGSTDRRAVGMASTSPRLNSGGSNDVEGGRNHYGRLSDGEMPNSQSIGLKPLSTRGSDGGNASPAGIVCAQEGETALDSMAGRVQAANRSQILKESMNNWAITSAPIRRAMGICPQGQDCLRSYPHTECRLFPCDVCGDGVLRCSLCDEAHQIAGHVSDADNAAAGKF